MKEINLASVDLNLLVVFDAVMTDRSVSQAARRLNLTQPAVSHALGRLRALLKDQLFVRTPKGMQPTALAEAIAAQVAGILSDIRSVLAPSEPFDPALSTRKFAIGMNDYTAFVILPALTRRLKDFGPKMELAVHPSSRATAKDLIDRDEIELFVGGSLLESGSYISSEFLFKGDTVCAARKEHPAFQRDLTRETYLAYPHLHVSPWVYPGLIDEYLKKQGVTRRIGLTISQFLLAPAILERTDLIATLPERAARPLARHFDLAVRKAPFAFEETEIFQIWHTRLDNDPALAWLRAQIAAVAREL